MQEALWRLIKAKDELLSLVRNSQKFLRNCPKKILGQRLVFLLDRSRNTVRSMSIDFPYEKKVIDEGELVDPRLPLEVETKFGFLTVKFLVDSGADVTTLPLNPYQELFDFKIDHRRKVVIGGVEGRGVVGYPFGFRARLKGFIFNLRCYFLQSRIDPLLGRLDFWDSYSITFDNRKLKTVLTPLKGKLV